MRLAPRHKKRIAKKKKTLLYNFGASSSIIAISIALLGCQKGQDELDPRSNKIPIDEESKSVNTSVLQKAPLSLKEEFDKSIRETNNGRKEISQSECTALTNKAFFKYHADKQSTGPIYLIEGEMIPIESASNNKCYISKPIIPGEALKTFTYSEAGVPLTSLEEMWSLEKIEACQPNNYQFTPKCETLVKYTKEIFADDKNNPGEISRREFSIHHREPLNSWMQEECYLVHGTEPGVCRTLASPQLLKKYREYISSGSNESFAEYTAYKSVQLD